MEKPLVNRVAKSGIITLNLEDFFPAAEIVPFDLKDYLFMELVLKEKDFRTALKEHDWSQYDGKVLAVFCSTDAIIPVWAYMLVTVHASPIAKQVVQMTEEEYIKAAYQEAIDALDIESYEGDRIVIKGCSNKPVPPFAYAYLTQKLVPVARSIMYGEPCSMVPLFKRPKK